MKKIKTSKIELTDKECLLLHCALLSRIDEQKDFLEMIKRPDEFISLKTYIPEYEQELSLLLSLNDRILDIYHSL